MKKIWIFSLLLCMSSITWAQKYYTNKGTVGFYSSTPIEDIKAVSNKAAALVKPGEQSIIVVVENKSFVFPKALMQEHFNENYMESDKFPKSTFTGKYDTKIDPEINGKYTVTVSGSLIIHGVKKEISAPATIEVRSGTIIGHCVFKVKTADYNIKIPKVVIKNIAEDIQITIDFSAPKI